MPLPKILLPHRSLTLKLSYAFFGVSIIGILLMAIFAYWIIQREFDAFVGRSGRAEIIAELSDYYARNGSWEGVENLNIRGSMMIEVGQVLAVVDPDNQEVFPLADTDELEVIDDGFLLSFDNRPIMLNGQVVGRLTTELSGETFFESVQQALVLAVLASIVLSMVLGIFFSRTLTWPLRELTMATQAVAAGDLNQRVRLQREDELGQLAQSFNQMTVDLADSRDLRRQMTADIAHDLRTPLSLILGHSEALADGVLPPTPSALHIIHDEALRLNRLVEDLRTLSLAEANELPLMIRPVEPATLLARTIQAYTPLAQDKAVTLTLQVSDQLPEIEVDPDRIVQVLDNLVSNALRHTSAGGSIILTAQPAPSGIHITVSDTGQGIPPEDLQRIFERFYRADKSRARHKGGSGLGLAISKSIIESHHGRISAESTISQGSTFNIYLPLAAT